MPKVVGVRFRTSPRMYWFSPVGEDDQYKKGVSVIVETQRGVELATVVMPPEDVDDDKIVAPLKPVLRVATESDLDAIAFEDGQKREMLITAKQKVEERGLEMKIVDCEYAVDRSKLVLYFTAEQRVDFRELVRDLASAFHMRIDLRQISARDECKLIGSLGPCGMPCCCGGFESDSEHVSIKMAKNQSLALTPGKINGMCGRLLCCLGYENKTYEDVLKRAPKHGTFVTAPDGRRGSVVSVTPLTETVRVRFGDDENFEFGDFQMSELSYERRQNDERKDDKHGGEDKPGPERAKNTDRKKNDRKNKEHKNRESGADSENASPEAPGEHREKNGKNKRRGGKNRNKNRRNNGNNGGVDGAPTQND